MSTPIRQRPAQHSRPGRSQRTLVSVVGLTANQATYRMLDYWARQGRIDIGPNPGTGNWRQLSDAEVCAILDVVAENQRLAALSEFLRSGDFYRERLAWHAEHPSNPWAEADGADLEPLDLGPQTSCVLCDEPMADEPSVSIIQPMHRACSLRSVTGGIGHHLDHEHFCKTLHDPDAGLDYRTSALLVDELVARRGPPAMAGRDRD